MSTFNRCMWPVYVLLQNSYKSIVGHACVGRNIVEEREIALKMRQHNLSVNLYLTDDLAFCKMYDDFNSAINRFSNNFFGGSKLKSWQFLTFAFATFLAFFPHQFYGP